MVLSELRMGTLGAIELVGCVICSGGGSVSCWVGDLCGFAIFPSVDAMDGVHYEGGSRCKKNPAV
jgi:hypothetical protein